MSTKTVAICASPEQTQCIEGPTQIPIQTPTQVRTQQLLHQSQLQTTPQFQGLLSAALDTRWMKATSVWVSSPDFPPPRCAGNVLSESARYPSGCYLPCSGTVAPFLHIYLIWSFPALGDGLAASFLVLWKMNLFFFIFFYLSSHLYVIYLFTYLAHIFLAK